MSTIRWIFISVAMLCAAGLLAAVLTPSLRHKIQSYFAKNGREVLATAEGDLLNNGTIVKVVKFRTSDGVYVEILKINDHGASDPVDRLLLPDKHDGLFNFRGHVTRLAIVDIDGDSKNELLAPTFDNQLVPHLNVFRYNAELGRFELFKSAQ